ncbi:MAG: D-glycero-beta-D-manno-heptose 1,7-bisphosphate 7-phosphatase [Deltaproteobacteria bacterium]|nr:D-glycero-beta-D-manno-heptose 1,7-bisphosphate 7-phosphatase [Deltaproteobacteria bacterium]MBW1993007.1 D-glycero-beta-D-manno-heptose 1,7-bisphosphate 7-phosphatase [Deltaproteobacteria bacterium]
MLTKVVFLDRDGVINEDSADYIKSWAEFHFIPGSLEALRRLTVHGFTTFLITNQSAVHRKLMSLAELEHIHVKMLHAVVSCGGRIEDIFFCPHLPEEECNCRKPKPGLIFEAQSRYDIKLSNAYLVGDSVKDMQCARNAGCGFAVLVRTGNGRSSEKMLAEKSLVDHVADDLLDAVQWIIDHDPQRGC